MSIHREGRSYRVRWREERLLKSRTFARKIDAEKFQARIILEEKGIDSSEKLIASEIGTELKFTDFQERWFRDYARANKTRGSIMNDESILKIHLLPRWGDRHLDKIRKLDIQELQSELANEGRLSRKTVNNVTGLVHKLFKDAVSWDLVPTNPCEGIKPLKFQEQEVTFWTFEERDHFLAFCKDYDPSLHDLVAVAIFTGMRRGEMQGLKRDCLDFDNRHIVIRRSYCGKSQKLLQHTKGKTIRRIPMNTAVYEIMKTRWDLGPNDDVLPADYSHLVERRFKPAQRLTKVRTICWHDLRHSFASHLAMSGVSMFDIKSLLGHAQLSTTLRYSHLAPNHLSGLTDVLMGGNRRAPQRPDFHSFESDNFR